MYVSWVVYNGVDSVINSSSSNIPTLSTRLHICIYTYIHSDDEVSSYLWFDRVKAYDASTTSIRAPQDRFRGTVARVPVAEFQPVGAQPCMHAVVGDRLDGRHAVRSLSTGCSPPPSFHC